MLARPNLTDRIGVKASQVLGYRLSVGSEHAGQRREAHRRRKTAHSQLDQRALERASKLPDLRFPELDNWGSCCPSHHSREGLQFDARWSWLPASHACISALRLYDFLQRRGNRDCTG